MIKTQVPETREIVVDVAIISESTWARLGSLIYTYLRNQARVFGHAHNLAELHSEGIPI